MKKFLSSFRNNIGLKLLSLLIAVVIWYVVVDVNDPLETETYSVKITVANEGYIANGKQIYHIDDSYKTVNVFVKANRSTLKHITADNITVTADLTQIVDMDLDPVMVPLSATCSGVAQSGVTLARTAIPITIETIDTQTFAVTVDTGDSDPSQEYEVGTMTPNPNQITISGPESIVSQISTAIARIDVTGMTRSSTKTATLILLDKNSEEISQDTINDDLKFEGENSVPSIMVDVELWKRKTDVVLKVEYGGMPASGYHVEEVNITPETISVVGDTEALRILTANGNTLTIGTDQISIAGASEDVITEIDLQQILPEGMRLSRNSAETATVTVMVLSDESTEIKLDVDEIEVQNLEANLSVAYGQTELTFRVIGPGSLVSTLTAEDLAASIDLAGISVGEYTVPVTVALPEGVSLEEDIQITVSLKEGAATETEEEESVTEDTEDTVIAAPDAGMEYTETEIMN